MFAGEAWFVSVDATGKRGGVRLLCFCLASHRQLFIFYTLLPPASFTTAYQVVTRHKRVLRSPFTVNAHRARAHTHTHIHTHLLDFFRELEPLDVLLGLQDGLHVAVALQQALAVQVPLLDVLLAPGVDSLEQRLQLRLREERTRSSEKDRQAQQNCSAKG